MVFSPGFQVNEFMCAVAGCPNTVYARGLCRTHYDRDRRTGSPVRMERQRPCPECHRYFLMSRSGQLFCSDRCRVNYKRHRDYGSGLPEHPETIVSSRMITEADFEKPIEVEQFTDSQVVEKCGGLCAKCHKPVVVGSSGADGAAYVWKVPLEKSHSATLANRLLVHKRCKGGTS